MPKVTDLDTKISTLVYGLGQTPYTTQEFPTRNALVKLPPDEQIAIVCDRYKFWILNFVEKLAQEPNSGYAILSMLNSYFDMIASLSGFAHLKPKDRVKTGMTLVFKELGNQPDIVELLEDRLRNPMAHMGITKDHVILIDLYDKPIVWGEFHNTDAIVINARLWARHICDHFEEFVSNLQDPNPQFDNLRQHFLERIKNPA